MLKWGRFYWDFFFTSSSVEQCAGMATPPLARLKNVFNLRLTFCIFRFFDSRLYAQLFYLYLRSIVITRLKFRSVLLPPPSQPICLVRDHQWRRVMIFPRFTERDMILLFWNYAADGINDLTIVTGLNSLTWLALHRRLLLICLISSYQISKALDNTLKAMLTVFGCESSITASGTSNELYRNVCGGRKHDHSLSVQKKTAQCWRCTRIGLGTKWRQWCKFHNSNSVHSRSDCSIYESGQRHCSLSSLWISVAGSKTGYDLLKSPLVDLVLTDSAFLFFPYFGEKQKIPSLVFLHFLVPFFRRHTNSASKISSFIIWMKRRNELHYRQSIACWNVEPNIPYRHRAWFNQSRQSLLQVHSRHYRFEMGKVCISWRRFSV